MTTTTRRPSSTRPPGDVGPAVPSGPRSVGGTAGPAPTPDTSVVTPVGPR